MLSHLTAYNFHFQLNKISAVLGWSSSSNLALVVLGSIRKMENLLRTTHSTRTVEVKPAAVHRN